MLAFSVWCLASNSFMPGGLTLRKVLEPFHVRVLAPDGERQHFDEYLSNRFVPLIG